MSKFLGMLCFVLIVSTLVAMALGYIDASRPATMLVIICAIVGVGAAAERTRFVIAKGKIVSIVESREDAMMALDILSEEDADNDDYFAIDTKMNIFKAKK
jgi:hypothetical protein